MNFNKLIWVAALSAAAAGWGEVRRGDARLEKAIFAAGCFWCIQASLDETPGIVKTTVGYTGGEEANPTYKQVASGKTGHREAIEVTYRPSQVSYEKLLGIFWDTIDPTTPDGQFADKGPAYHTAIFYYNEEQLASATKSKEQLDQSGKYPSPVATEILPAVRFWPAEDYHQKYYLKSPEAYQQYKDRSGRKEYYKHMRGK